MAQTNDKSWKDNKIFSFYDAAQEKEQQQGWDDFNPADSYQQSAPDNGTQNYVEQTQTNTPEDTSVQQSQAYQYKAPTNYSELQQQAGMQQQSQYEDWRKSQPSERKIMDVDSPKGQALVNGAYQVALSNNPDSTPDYDTFKAQMQLDDNRRNDYLQQYQNAYTQQQSQGRQIQQPQQSQQQADANQPEPKVQDVYQHVDYDYDGKGYLRDLVGTNTDQDAINSQISGALSALPAKTTAQNATDKRVAIRTYADGRKEKFIVTKVDPTNINDDRYIDDKGQISHLPYVNPDDELTMMAQNVKDSVTPYLQKGDYKGAFDTMVNGLTRGQGAYNVTNFNQDTAKAVFDKLVSGYKEEGAVNALNDVMGNLEAELAKANAIKTEAEKKALAQKMPTDYASMYATTADPEVYNAKGGTTLDAVNNLEAQARERLKALGYSDADVDRMAKGFRTDVERAIIEKGTNKSVAETITSNPAYQNVIETVMNVGGGITESMLGKAVFHQFNNYDNMLLNSTRMFEQGNMDMGTQILRGGVTMGTDIATQWYFLPSAMATGVMSRAVPMIDRAVGYFPKLYRAIKAGEQMGSFAARMDAAPSAAAFGRAFAMSKTGLFTNDIINGVGSGAIMFSTADAAKAGYDFLTRTVLPVDMESDVRRLLQSMTPEGAVVDPETVAHFSNGNETLYQNICDGISYINDHGMEGALQGSLFFGGAFGNIIGRNRTMGYKILGDITKLGINASAVAAVDEAREAGDWSWDRFFTQAGQNVLNFTLLEAHPAFKRYKNIEAEINAEHRGRDKAGWQITNDNNNVPDNEAMLKGIADGSLNLPQADAEHTDASAPQVQLFKRTKGADGKVTQLTPEQKRVEDNFNGFLRNSAIPQSERAERAYIVTGQMWKLTNPTSVSYPRYITENGSYAVDLLDEKGNVIDTHFYASEEAAKAGRVNLDEAITVSDLGDIKNKYITRKASGTFDETLRNEWNNGLEKKVKKYNYALQRQQNGEKLTTRQQRLLDRGLTQHEQDMALLFGQGSKVMDVIQKMRNGEQLTEEDLSLLNVNNRLYTEHLKNTVDSNDLAAQFEIDNDLDNGELDKIMKGHSEKSEAKAIVEKEGGEVVKMGDKWYTTGEMQTLRDYRQTILDEISADDAYQEQKAAEAVNATLTDLEKRMPERSDAEIQAQAAADNAFTEGQQLQGKERTQAMNDFGYLQTVLAQRLGIRPEEVDTRLGLAPNQSGKDVLANVDNIFLHPEQRKAVRDYLLAREKANGITEAIRQKMNAAGQDADAQVKNITNADGTVKRIVTKKTANTEENQELYVVSGNINRQEDGSVTNEGSDGLIIATDAEGNLYRLSPSDIKSADLPIDGSEYAQTARAQAMQDAIAGDFAEIDGKVQGTVGEQVDIKTGNEKKVATVVDSNGQGTVVVDIDGKQTTMRLADLQEMHDQLTNDETLARHTAPVETETKAEQPTAPEAPKTETRTEEPKAETPAPAEEEKAPEVKTAPVEEKRNTGEPIYNEEGGIDVAANDPAEVYDYYHSKGMDDFAKDELAQAKKDLADAQATKPEGTTAKEREQAYEAKNNAVKAAQDRVDFWNKVLNEPERRADEMRKAVDEAAPVEEKAPEQQEEKLANKTKEIEQISFDYGEERKQQHNEAVAKEGGFIINDEGRSLGGDIATVLDTFGKQIGAVIRCDNSLISFDKDGKPLPSSKQTNGFFFKNEDGLNEIIINPLSAKPTSFIMGHETTHHLRVQNSERTWNAYVDTVKAAMGEADFKAKFDATRTAYDDFCKLKKMPKLSDDDIIEEVCSDFAGDHITSDKKFAQDLMDKIAESGESSISVAKRINNYIDSILASLKRIINPTLTQRQQIEAYEQAKELWGGMVEYAAAKERERKAETGSITEVASADESGINFAGGKASVNTEDELRRKIEDFAKGKEAKRLGWTQDQIDDIAYETTDLVNTIHAAIAGDSNYDEFARKNPTMVVDWRDGIEKPIVTWVRNNIEYKYDMSADTFCINNEGLETVLASPTMADLMLHMAGYTYNPKEKDEGHKSGFKSDDYLRLYSTLRDMGFVVPCKGCFDAATRFKMLPSVAQNFVKLVNDTIDERNKRPKTFDKELKKMKGEKVENGLPASASTQELAVRIAVAGDNLTKHVNWTQLMSAQGQTQALTDWGGLFRAWQKTGAGRPKDKLNPEPYTGQIMTSATTIIAPYGEKTPAFRDMEVNQGTGLRRNSHSEYRPILAVDEIQFMRDAWLKHLCVFKYMKELDDVRLFGKMGTKFNMSTFPAWYEDGVAAGLDKDGNYAIAEESVGGREFPYVGEDGRTHYDGYKGLEEAKRYVNKDCSLSSVAFSVPHLIKLMTDVPTPSDKSGDYGSLIPFHATGATAYSLWTQGLGRVRGLQSGSFMKEAFSDYQKGVTNFEDVQNDRFGEGWKCLLGTNAGKDVEYGHKIEFANGTIYRNDDLGITLYSSPLTYKNNGGDPEVITEVKLDKKGNPVIDKKTGEVKRKQNVSGNIYTLDSEDNKIAHELHIDYNDKVRELGGDYSYKEAADYYVDLLPKLGLVPRFEFKVPAETYLKMCEEAHIDPNHPKLGWKGGNEPWSPCDAESYYSLFCDYGMTDPETGKYSPHTPILDGQRDADAFEKALPDNYLQIIQDGINRYTERKTSEDSKINDAIGEFCKRSIADGKMDMQTAGEILTKHGFTPEQLKQYGIEYNPDNDPNRGGKASLPTGKEEKNSDRMKEVMDHLKENVPADEYKGALGVAYQGSKNKNGREIVSVLPQGKRFVDLFSGGGAMTHAAILSGKYDSYHMNDKYPMGQQLFLDGMEGKYHDYDRHVTKEEFYNGMQYTPEGLMHSFNGNGRGYAAVDANGRDKAAEQVKRVKALEAMKDSRSKITDSAEDYQNVPIQNGDVLYADIPYENTGNTSYKNAGKFDMKAFTDWAGKLNQPVYVSSFEAPEGFTEIWHGKEEPSFRAGSRKVERLFVQDKFADAEKERIAGQKKTANIKFSIGGEVGADEEQKKDLEIAKQMQEAGKKPLAIKQATGWEVGADGKWKYEMEDFPYPARENNPKTLGEAYPEDHPLFKAYPQLKDIKLDYSRRTSTAGSYSNLGNSITISKEIWNDDYGKNYLRSVIQHEVQHAVQRIEGFATGTSQTTEKNTYMEKAKNEQPVVYAANFLFGGIFPWSKLKRVPKQQLIGLAQGGVDGTTWDAELKTMAKDFIDAANAMSNEEFAQVMDAAAKLDRAANKAGKEGYKNSAGEVEANNVETRLGWSDEKRRNTTLEETEDVSRKKQVVKYSLTKEAIFGDESLSKKERNEKWKNFVTTSYDRTSAFLKNDGMTLDNLGNPIDADGKLIVEKVEKIDDITEDDIETPSRSIELPSISHSLSKALNADGKAVVIKRNVFEKNSITHPELETKDSLEIITNALYKTYKYGKSQPIKRPNYSVVLYSGERNNDVAVVDVEERKDNIEMVGWRKLDEKGLRHLENQIKSEGGQFLILTPETRSAEALSALRPDLISDRKGTNNFVNDQTNSEESSEINTSANSGLQKEGKPSINVEERDKEYADAVNSGNIAKAKEMLKEEADRKLNTVILPDDKDIAGFKYHTGEAPKKTFKRYAVLNISPEGFKAAYAGNKNGTPVGVWLDAQNLQSYTSDMVQFDDGTFASYIKGDTGASVGSKFSPEKREEYGLKGSDKFLLERGGKHSSDVPNFSQMNLHQNENGEKVSSAKEGALPHNKLIFEIEYGTSENGDLTEYVKEHGRMAKGKNQGLAKIEPNQYYDFKTNPNAVGNWGIGGTFRITRLVPHDEIVSKTEEYKQNAIAEANRAFEAGEISKSDRDKQIKNANAITVQKWVGGYHPEDFGLSVESVNKMYEDGTKQKVLDITYDDNGKLIPLSQRYDNSKKDIRYSIPVGAHMRQRKGESDADFMQRQQDYINLAVKNPAEARKRVMEEIKSQLDDEKMSAMGKRALNEMLKQVRDADDKNIKTVIKDVNRTMNQMSDRALNKQMDRLLSFKTQKRNGRNMSIAKSVDDATRKAFDFMRGKLVDFKATDYDDEKHQINSDLSRLYRETKYLQRQHDASTDPAEQQRLEQMIADNMDTIEQNKEQLKQLNEQIATAQQQNQPINQTYVQDGITDLNEKYNNSLTGNGEWTDEDEAKLTAFQILNKRLRLNDLNDEMTVQKDHEDVYRMQLVQAHQAGNKQYAALLQRDIDACVDMQDDILQQTVALKREIASDLTNMINGGKDSLNEKMKAEHERKSNVILGFWNDITRGAYNESTPQGVNAYNARLGKTFGGIQRGLRGVMGSFEYMAQHMAKNSLGKDSWFYKYFMQSENGVMAAQENYLEGLRKSQQTMNDKCREIYGDNYKKTIKENEKLERNHGITIPVDENGISGRTNAGFLVDKDGKMTKGQATYLYMVWKMPDGRAKLEKMGFDEQSIAEAEEFIGDENKAWADWVQEEYLVGLRQKYNEKYKEMYNTSMAEIPNYVPLKINGDTRHQDVDVAEMMGQQSLNQKAGSLINRTHNLNPVDLQNSAYDVVSQHVKDMEEWNAMARVRQDLNYILSSTAIRNTMNANERASHERLVKAAQIATGCYKSDVPDASKYVSTLTQGLAGANIAFRNTTALKQMLSLPAFFGYSQNPKYLAMLLKNAGVQYGYHAGTFVGTAATFGWLGKHAMDSAASSEKTDKMSKFALSDTMRWCIDNVPTFRNRVAKGSVGNVILDELLSNDTTKFARFKAKLGQYGMAANGLVDAVTCAIGIKTIYDFRYGQLKDAAKKAFNAGEIGQEEYDQRLVEADRMARNDADIYYNGTQQSNHPAFLAPVQMDGDLASKMFTLYKNSPLSYARKALLPAQDLWKLKNWKQLADRQAGEYMKAEGLTYDEALAKANKHLAASMMNSVVGVGLYGYMINWLWNWGGKGLLGLMQGDNDDDKDKNGIVKTAEALAPVLNGVPAVDFIVQTAAGQDVEPLLLYDIQKRMATLMAKKDGGIDEGLAFDCFNNAVRIGVGLDLNTLTNVYLGAEHLVKNGLGSENRSKLVDLMFLLNTPNSNRKQVARTVYSEFSPEEFDDAVMRAEKALDEGSEDWHKHLAGYKIIEKSKHDAIRKEYWQLRQTADEKAEAERKKANTKEEISKAYPDNADLQYAFDNETDPSRKQKMYELLRDRAQVTSGQAKSVNDLYQQAKDALYKEKKEKESAYVQACTAEDAAEDAAVAANLKSAKQYQDRWKELGMGTDAGQAYQEEHQEEIAAGMKIQAYQNAINKLKASMKYAETDEDKEAILEQIRNLRKLCLE